MGRVLILAAIVLLVVITTFLVPSCDAPAPDIRINRLEVTPSTINEGETAYIQWDSTGATMVTIDNSVGEVQLSGKKEIKPSQTTKYTLLAKNNRKSVEQAVTITVNPRTIEKVQEETPIPTVSALDTKQLFKQVGQETRVEGDITYISSWLPTRYRSQGTTRPWTFIFFMPDVLEGYASNPGVGEGCTECWRDFTSYFRVIIKPDDLPAFRSYFGWGLSDKEQTPIGVGVGPSARGGVAPTVDPLSAASAGHFSGDGFIVDASVHILLQSVIENYLSAPAIYLTNTKQIISLQR